ncbi:MAG: hypothetical protein KDC12_15270 [Flavobacteriales bacterium]|nr:hypothetical protein [Flavobacteriales bacterium]
MNQHNIDQLVTKFWNGETSLEEEAALSEYFAYNEVPEKYLAVASYFDTLNEPEPELSSDFDQRILAEIQGKKPRNGRIVMLRPFVQAVAVVAAIFLLALVFINPGDDGQLTGTSTAVTEENVLHDPQVFEAFQQTRSALFMVSSKLNQGREQSLKLTKFNEVQDNLKSDSDEETN